MAGEGRVRDDFWAGICIALEFLLALPTIFLFLIVVLTYWGRCDSGYAGMANAVYYLIIVAPAMVVVPAACAVGAHGIAAMRFGVRGFWLLLPALLGMALAFGAGCAFPTGTLRRSGLPTPRRCAARAPDRTRADSACMPGTDCHTPAASRATTTACRPPLRCR